MAISRAYFGIRLNVYLALATIYNSSAVNGLGAQFFSDQDDERLHASQSHTIRQ